MEGVNEIRSPSCLKYRSVPHTEIAVIGAGVVGLAVAARLARQSPNLIVLDRNPKHGMETSSRNSQVVHAGIYYPAGSLKARLCAEGRDRVYDLCARHAIPHAKLGKLITATRAAELPALDALEKTARGNGVRLTRLSESEAHALEPMVASVGGLWSPESGIVDAHGLMDHFLRQALEAGAVLQPRAAVVAIEPAPGGYRIVAQQAGGLESFTAERIVNAAGLDADTVAALAGIEVDAAGYRLHYCKGSYFSAATRLWKAVTHLVYPVPAHESLGVHVVLDTGGRLRFGPTPSTCPTGAPTTGSSQRSAPSLRRPRGASCPRCATRTSSPTSAASGRSCREKASRSATS